MPGNYPIIQPGTIGGQGYGFPPPPPTQPGQYGQQQGYNSQNYGFFPPPPMYDQNHK